MHFAPTHAHLHRGAPANVRAELEQAQARAQLELHSDGGFPDAYAYAYSHLSDSHPADAYGAQSFHAASASFDEQPHAESDDIDMSHMAYFGLAGRSQTASVYQSEDQEQHQQ